MIRKTVASAAALVAAGAFLTAGYAQAAPSANASAILDFNKNFSDANGSQGVSVAPGGCQNVTTTANGSLQFVTGTFTLFTGANCTGGTWVVSTDVKDLAAIGFNGKLASIGFGDVDTTKPATGAVLDNAPNFSDANGSEGIGGKPGSCTNVQPGLVSSVDFNDGRMHLYTGAGCTGRSIVIDGDVTDLGALGFDKLTASVKLG
jgi:uncharacterized protein YaiE (UPF0345 family)